MDEQRNAVKDVRFLSDDPTVEDKLGGRRKVAQAIADVFTSAESGTAIALTGSWGSGKSSIVRMVSDLVETQGDEEQDLAILDFDAWCHKGDPLRCAFLVELGDRLSELGWLDEEWWEGAPEKKIVGKKDQITKRHSTTRTRTTPVLTRGGKLLGLALIIFPIFIGMIAALPANCWIGYSGLIASAVLFLGIAGIYVHGWINAEKKNGKKQVRFFSEEREIDETTTEYRTPDPTSFEFKTYFDDILEIALGQASAEDRKLMVVIDNLDRVEHSEARTIWATMQTFFERSVPPGPNNYRDRLWLLVPFDPEGLSRIWEAEPEEEPDAQQAGAEPEGRADRRPKEANVADSFKDKAFQITFHVPPPVLTHWKEFFEGKVALALPGHDDDYHSLYRLYDLRSLDNPPVTPRGIILYINRIAALHSQWGHEIPLVLQGLYAIREDIVSSADGEEESIRDLIEKLPSKYLAVIDESKHPDWQQKLAALHYGLSPEQALQMVYRPTVRNWLREGNVDEFSKIASVHGIPDVCEECIEIDVGSYTTEQNAAAARVLACFEDVDSSTVLLAWEKLTKGFLGAPQVLGLNEVTGSGIGLLVSHSPKLGVTGVTREAMRQVSTISVREDDEITDAIVDDWLAGVIPVLDSCDRVEPGGDWRDIFCVSNENYYTSIIMKMLSAGMQDDIFQYFTPCPGKAAPIITQLANDISKGMFTESHKAATEKMAEIYKDWPWDGLASAIGTRLRVEEELPVPEAQACVGSLTFLSYAVSDPTARSELEKLAVEGHLANRLSTAKAHEDLQAIADIIFPMLLFRPNGDITGQPGSAQQGIEYYSSASTDPAILSEEGIAAITERCVRFGQIRFLVENILPTNAKELTGTIINHLPIDDSLKTHLTSDLFLARYSLLRDLLTDETFTNIVARLTTSDDLVGYIKQSGFAQDHVSIYLQIVQLQDEVDVEYATWLAQELRGTTSQEEWKKEFQEPTDLMQLLLALTAKGVQPDMTPSFGDALFTDIEESMETGGELRPTVVDNADLLMQAMEAGAKKSFLDSLFDYSAKQVDRSLSPLLEVFGEALYAPQLMDRKEEYFRTLFKIIIQGDDLDELAWINRALAKSTLVKEASTESKQSFVSRLKEKYNQPETEEGVKTELERIAVLLGAKLGHHAIDNNQAKGFESWTAHTNLANRMGISFRELATAGQAITSLSFTVQSDDEHWRAGVLFESAGKKDSIAEVDTLGPDAYPLVQKDSLLFHVGKNDYTGRKDNNLLIRDKNYCATAYYDQESAITSPKRRLKEATVPEIILGDINNGEKIRIQMKYSKDTGIEFWVNDKKIEHENARSLLAVDPEIFNKVFLVAWADEVVGDQPDTYIPREYAVSFRDIKIQTADEEL